MKILVSCMGFDGGKSGISAYMRNVVGCMRESNHDITILTEYDDVNEFAGLKKIIAPKRLSKSAGGFLWHMLVSPFYARKFDAFIILAANRRFQLWGKTPTVGVVHDLSQYRVEGKYDALRMFYLSKLQPFLGRKITKIAAISLTTKADIEKYWKVSEDRVELNYNGCTPRSKFDDAILKKLNLGKYIYYVSRIEHPGKNHINLIKAFEELPCKDEYQLVFTGSNWNGSETVREYAKNSPCKDKIVFTGFVSNEEIASLYKNASLFVFPSFSEGFGLGLVEAMSAGVPCACSKDSALGEVAADAALKFDPHSIDEICLSMEKILTNSVLRNNLIEKGHARAKDFDWQKHADKLISMAENAANKNSRLKIFDVNFDNARMDDIVSKLVNHALSGEKKTVAFINTHYLNTAYEDREQLDRLNKFDYVLPDGSGVSIACKILSYPYRDNLNGTDLLPRLCEKSSEHGLTMYFLGGKDSVAERAAKNLLKMFPELKIVGTHKGYFQKGKEENDLIEEINKAAPDFLFVGFGAKLQEKWVIDNIDKLNCKIAFAIGGVCDVYSGDLFRVHPKLRQYGLEWLGRLYQDPVRLFGRYVIGNPLFVFRVLKYRFFGMKK